MKRTTVESGIKGGQKLGMTAAQVADASFSTLDLNLQCTPPASSPPSSPFSPPPSSLRLRPLSSSVLPVRTPTASLAMVSCASRSRVSTCSPLCLKSLLPRSTKPVLRSRETALRRRQAGERAHKTYWASQLTLLCPSNVASAMHVVVV